MDIRGQISAELLIVLAAMAALALLLVSQLQKTAEDMNRSLSESENKLVEHINSIYPGEGD